MKGNAAEYFRILPIALRNPYKFETSSWQTSGAYCRSIVSWKKPSLEISPNSPFNGNMKMNSGDDVKEKFMAWLDFQMWRYLLHGSNFLKYYFLRMIPIFLLVHLGENVNIYDHVNSYIIMWVIPELTSLTVIFC